MVKPKVVAFDVIETLFSLDYLKEIFENIGLKPMVLETWFTTLLRDAFALEITGKYKEFKEIATSTLEVTMKENCVEPEKEKINKLLEGFKHLKAYDDVLPAFKKLQDSGISIISLTNGSAINRAIYF